MDVLFLPYYKMHIRYLEQLIFYLIQAFSSLFGVMESLFLKRHYNLYKNHEYCDAEIPNEDNKILKCNRGKNL